MALLRSGKTQLLIVGYLLFASLSLYSQNAPVTQGQENPDPESSKTGVYTGREIFVPKPQPEKEPEAAAATFANDFLRFARRHLGFTLRVSESYSPNAIVSDSDKRSVSIATIEPQIYLNAQKKRLNFRLNYGVVENRYESKLGKTTSLAHNGTSSLSYNLSRRKTTLEFSNNFASIYYDEGSLLTQSLTTPYRLDLVSQLYIDRRRETRNTTAITYVRTLTRKSSLSAGLYYDAAAYSGPNLGRNNVLSARVGVAYQVKKWLSFNTGYSHYLTGQKLGSDVQSLQVGGFSFKPARGWIISASGGIDSTGSSGFGGDGSIRSSKTRWIVTSGQASISKSSPRTTISLAYHRGFFTIFPTSEVWYGDSANLNVVQKLSRRVNIQASSSLLTGLTLGQSYQAKTVYGGAGLDIALLNNLVFLTNYNLVSQKVTYTSFSGENLHRYTVVAGFQYFLPGVVRR